MAQKVIVPRLGQTMTEGTVARFYVKDGDSVQADTNIYELEYDKSTAPIPAKKAGTIRLLVAEGAVVPVGQPVAVVLEDGETLESVQSGGASAVAKETPAPAAAPAAAPAPVAAAAAPAAKSAYSAAPRIKALAKEMGIDLAAVVPANGKRITQEDLEAYAAAQKAAAAPAKSAYSAAPRIKALAKEMGIDLAAVVPANGKRITQEDLEAYAAAQKAAPAAEAAPAAAPAAGGYKASPLARKVAESLGVDISKVVPKDGKRVNRDDVEAYAAAQKSDTSVNFHGGPECGTTCRRCNWTAPEAPTADRREKMSGMRKVISQRMTESANLYPSATLTTKVDMTELLKVRQQLNKELAARGVKLTVTDLLVKATAKALRENEIINTTLEGDEIVYRADVNIGIAVALDNGLVVPVVRNADKLSLPEINAESSRLIKKAKGGGLSGADMADGTFSITNLGMVGIDAFTPIINMPQSAILGIGRTVEEPAVYNGEITIRSKAVLSITHDHRVIDGYPAALFLQSMTKYIENPVLLLLD
ncbi:MAG: 2-oxo acid dehydrogenase subunit E2 [Oscillospiraceae bacterium]|nr:2-oxo acid dehydrogenase subunit E2 [Oscillospiraceae bacterium]